MPKLRPSQMATINASFSHRHGRRWIPNCVKDLAFCERTRDLAPIATHQQQLAFPTQIFTYRIEQLLMTETAGSRKRRKEQELR